MGNGEIPVTIGELTRLLQSQVGEFIIHVGIGEEDADGETGNIQV